MCISLAETKIIDSSSQGNGVAGRAAATTYEKYITGTLFGSGYNTLVSHGISLNKMLTFSVSVNAGNGYYPPGYSYSTGYGFQTYIDSNYVRINPTIGNANYIYGKPFLIYIVYTS